MNISAMEIDKLQNDNRISNNKKQLLIQPNA
jgi:hypothetical protein